MRTWLRNAWRPLLVAALCVAGCKKPDIGFRFKATDNSMETFLPGGWHASNGDRYEITGDELFTWNFETVMNPKKPHKSKCTIHAAGKFTVNGDQITFTFLSLVPTPRWAESGDLEQFPAKLRKDAEAKVPLNTPHVGKLLWKDIDHVTIKMQADLTGPARTIELSRDGRI